MIPTDVIRDTRYLPRYDKIQFKKKRLLGLPELQTSKWWHGKKRTWSIIALPKVAWEKHKNDMKLVVVHYLVVEEEICTFHLNNGVIEWAALWHHLHDVWWSLSMLDMAAGSKSVMLLLLPHICPFFLWIFPASSHVIAVFFKMTAGAAASSVPTKVRPKSGIKSDELNWNLRCCR